MDGEEKVLQPAENQFNFHNIGKAICKFKWFILGATVVGGVAGYLVFSKGINPGRETLVSSFGYNINASPKFDENVSIKAEDLGNETLYLCDSSIFSYTDIVSEERLVVVKESNAEAFGKINVVKMARNGGIKISKASYTEQVTGKVIYEYPAKYTITANKSYFSSEQQGKDFIAALINSELNIAKAANENYEIVNYLGSNTDASYGLYVKNLTDQYNAINECYTNLIKDFDNSSIADAEGNSLNKLYNSFVTRYSSGASNLLLKYEGELYHNHLVDYEHATVDGLHNQAKSYKENIRSNLITLQSYQDSLEKLVNVQVTNVETNSQIEKEIVRINKQIMELKTANGLYIKELINLGYTVPNEVTLANVDTIDFNALGEGVIQSLTTSTEEWKQQCRDFKVSLDEASKKLSADRDLASGHYGYVNNKYRNQVNMYTAGVAVLTGHVSSVIGLVVGLLGMFILSTLVFTLIYIARREKYENKK